MTAPERMRARIQGQRIIDRIQAWFFNEPDPHTGLPVEDMTVEKANAGFKLLGKVLPDMRSIEMVFSDNGKLSREDINERLRAKGLDPELVWNQAQTQH